MQLLVGVCDGWSKKKSNGAAEKITADTLMDLKEADRAAKAYAVLFAAF